MAYLYLEHDGRVYTVRKGRKVTLPHEDDRIPFPYRILYRLPWGGEGIALGVPRLSHHPSEWISKDEVPLRDDVSPVLREAVYRTLPRAVAEAIIEREGKYLVVKAARGITRGRWSLPGGFLFFGESPDRAVEREVEEELGTACRVEGLLGVRAKVGSHTGLHWLMFFYRVSLLGEPRPDPDEIAEIAWLGKEEAASRLCDETMAAFLRSL